MIACKICSTIERYLLKFITPLDASFQKLLSLVFYVNRDPKISKSKKSEQYFRGKIEIVIRLFDEHFGRHFESH